MKIAQVYINDQIRLGIIEGVRVTPIHFSGTMIDFITGMPQWKPDGPSIPLDQVQFAPAVSNPSKIIALGLNYLDHAAEGKAKVPEVPLVFAKFPNSLIGHREEITWEAAITQKVDFEAELAVVIGKQVHCSDEKEVMEAVFGYTCANDVSARDLQFGDGQWVRGKSLDTFCPLGPWIVTREDIPDPHALRIRSVVNGREMQASNTGMMIFKLPPLLAFLSHHFSLMPGDVILTGTPHGVGAFRDPPVYLQDGDEVVVEIEGIGSLLNTCRVLQP